MHLLPVTNQGWIWPKCWPGMELRDSTEALVHLCVLQNSRKCLHTASSKSKSPREFCSLMSGIYILISRGKYNPQGYLVSTFSSAPSMGCSHVPPSLPALQLSASWAHVASADRKQSLRPSLGGTSQVPNENKRMSKVTKSHPRHGVHCWCFGGAGMFSSHRQLLTAKYQRYLPM